jgi:NAD(P)-dependent dehydrogenase (short-subunit alcohol dehydrogenase family)
MTDSISHSRTTVDALARLEGDRATVAVRRVETPRGERLEIAAPRLDASVRLDAVALEALLVQDADSILDFLPDDRCDVADTALVERVDVEASDAVLSRITNEFGHVDVQRVESAASPALEFHAPKIGAAMRLGPLALEGVTTQSQDAFTELLAAFME